jgi:hypothetical protein
LNRFRIFPAIVTALACASLTVLAQSPPADATKPATPAKAAPAKAEPKKADAKKKVEKKDEKAAEKKPAEKPAKKVEKPAAKADAKAKPAAPKTAEPRRAKDTDPVIEKYKAGQAPAIRDKDGNVIPTSPDAYNVDSARKK